MKDPSRLVLLGLPAASLVVLLTTAGRGDFRVPGDDGFAAWAASSGFDAWSSAMLNGAVWLVFGFLALYARTRDHVHGRWAQASTFFVVLGLAVFLPIGGVIAMAWPVAAAQAQDGEASALAVVQGIQDHGMFRVWTVFAGVCWALGILGWAWTLRAWPVAAMLLAVGGLAVAYPVNVAVDWGAAAVFVLATVLIAWRWWDASGRTTTSETPP